MLEKLLNSSRTTKHFISLCYDILAISFSLYLSLSLRYGELFFAVDDETLLSFMITMAATLVILSKFGLYRAILRYAPLETLYTIMSAVLVSSLILAGTSFFLDASIPRSSPIIYFLACSITVGAPRVLIRNLILFSRNGFQFPSRNPENQREGIIVYGAGYSGYQLALSMQHQRRYRIKAFVDDDRSLWRTKLKGALIYPTEELQSLAQNYQCNTVLLAIGNATKARRREIIEEIKQLGLQVKTIPPMEDIMMGKARIDEIKPVSIEELLGRDPVPPQEDLLASCVEGKTILVSGAGGSIGSELCRQILARKPERLLLVERSEFALYSIEQDLRQQWRSDARNLGDAPVVDLLADICDAKRMHDIMNTWQVDTVYHAAAYKHVPIVEHNMVAGVRNNILGTWILAEAAIANQVNSFVLVSTDKAVRPTNIMGTTKRCAELVLQGLAQRQQSTRFTMVRFGNVLGSSGSVIPLFRKQIRQGGPVTVTHPEITRYFMTIPEASQLVLQAGAMGTGGDVFVLDMGEPIKIVDLAQQMIQLSGMTVRNEANPDGDIRIEFTGLRPGEKMYEELLIGDNVSGTNHPRIMTAQEVCLSWSDTHSYLKAIELACDQENCLQLRHLLLTMPSGYSPDAKHLVDHLWSNRRTNLTYEHSGLDKIVPIKSV